MLLSGGLAVILVMIPYSSLLVINQFITTTDVLTILFYHLVLLSTVGMNTGAATLFWLYTDILINL
jgi:hypothetical protein